MKKQGSISDFMEERDTELRDLFLSRSGREAALYTTDHLLERAVKSPSSRFWVDPERARDILSRYSKDAHALDRMLPGRRAMYEALYARYASIRESKPLASMIECVTEAVYSEAPEFFLTPWTARRIVFKRNRRKTNTRNSKRIMP